MSEATPSFDIRALLDPGVYAHPVEQLRLKETHVSWIVLTGPYVYKIKKPVKLDFIDTATLERRRFLCEEELRLNRQLAPDLYVDVVPIVRNVDGLRVGGAGAPVEYAVRMKQFASADELQELLARNAVSGEEIEQLAVLLGEFHAHTPRLTGNDTATQRIFDTVLGNVHELTTLERSLGTLPHLEALADWLRERMLHDRERFLARERDGYIRECHGDLHSGNIVRWQGRLLPFDRLEFEPKLRWIDVMDDLAFLAMDLTSRGRPDLACVLVSRYCELNGDYAGVQLLPFYAVHRALVRAKVDALSARDIPHRRSEFLERLHIRLRAAERWMAPPRPSLVLMHGVSGSGKSWLSERLIPALPAIRIRSDVERKRLAGVSINENAEPAVYSQNFTQRTYARLSGCAAACLDAGFTTILDATFLDPSQRVIFRDLASRMDVPLAIVACTSDRQELERRILERAKSGDRVSDADLEVLAAQLQNLQPFDPQELDSVIRVDTRAPDAIARTVEAIGCRKV